MVALFFLLGVLGSIPFQGANLKLFIKQLNFINMNNLQFQKLAYEITRKNIVLYRYINNFEKYKGMIPITGDLQPSTSYGVSVDGSIDYFFKTTKKPETFFKSFINQHIRKYDMKQPTWGENSDGSFGFIYPKKEEVIKKYTTDRVSKYHYYTTLYGIGMFAFFTKDIVKATVKLAKYLESKGVKYYNEFSDRGWAYRFVINKDVETHNELLNDFNY
jgi:hypothetical protein